MCMAVPSLQANMEYFNISGFFSLALSLSVRTNLLSSVKISAQKCNGFAVSSNYKEPDCMSVLSLWLHQKSAGEWAMFGLLDLSLISIFCQSSVKSTQGQNHGCAALSKQQVLGYILLFLLSGSTKIESHSTDVLSCRPLYFHILSYKKSWIKPMAMPCASKHRFEPIMTLCCFLSL